MSHDRAVEINSVNHAFEVKGDRVQALSEIDFRIEPGQFLCLAGPSGCGKTTLLRLLAGFMHPTQGSIEVGGVPVTAPGADRGVVFQQPTLYPWLTVQENVELGPKLRGVKASQRRADAERFLHMVGLSDFAFRRPYELSGGMQQRCQIARVLTNDPDIVLMDEPFGALDALTREHLQNELLEIWRATGKTIVFITHSVDEAVFLGSRVMVMSPRPGRIVLDRPAVFSKPGEPVAPEQIRSMPEFLAAASEVRTAIQSAPLSRAS
jgi:ABC-type nitrate/sulfonate/bicarbonate transport system ATPase subunit